MTANYLYQLQRMSDPQEGNPDTVNEIFQEVHDSIEMLLEADLLLPIRVSEQREPYSLTCSKAHPSSGLHHEYGHQGERSRWVTAWTDSGGYSTRRTSP